MAFDPSRLSGKNLLSLRDAIEKSVCEDSLYDFLRKAWSAFDPSPFTGGWHLEALCLPGDVRVLTDRGERPIGEIVRSGMPVRVASYNHETASMEWQPVLNFMESPGKTILRLTTSSGLVLRCTEDHPIYVVGKGYVGAVHVGAGESVKTVRDMCGTIPRREKQTKILQTRLLAGLAGQPARGGNAQLPSLWEAILPGGSPDREDVLRIFLSWCRPQKAGKRNLRSLWKTKGAWRRALSQMLRKIKDFAEGLSLCALWETCEQVTGCPICNHAPSRGFLQHGMLWGPHSRGQQSGLHRWWHASGLRTWFQGRSPCHLETRGRRLLSLLGAGQTARRASYRPGQEQSFFVQPSSDLPSLSQCTEGHARGSLVEGCETIVSVEREVWIPDRVFNIEVRGNNNYFAGGVLVHNCEHLMAVNSGDIKRLLINVRFRSSKTSAVAIAWPVWTWLQQADTDFPLIGPGVRFLCGSYGANKAQEDAVTARRLIASEWFQRLWGGHVRIAKDRDNAERYDTTAGGARISTGIPESLGKGGMIKLLDDPQKTDEVESQKISDQVVKNYKEIWQTRSNDPVKSAEVMVMQRQGEADLSGYWLEHFMDEPNAVHLCIPAWYESDRHCTTYVNGIEFWTDPRSIEGESFWPQMLPQRMRARDEALGPYAFAGQCQQRPEPRGGGIIKRMWWQAWPPDNEIEEWTVDGGTNYPPWELQIAYLDTAFTKKETNDYCAMTRWGVFGNTVNTPCAMLCGAWEERHNFGELIEHVKVSCRAWKTDILIIENKAGGIWVRDELIREMNDGEITIVLDTPVIDKEARAHAIVPLFAGGLVYAPFLHDKGVWRAWAEKTISECEKFPTGRFKDLVDTVTGALGYLRRNDLIKLKQEAEEDEREAHRFKGNSESIAEQYGVA